MRVYKPSYTKPLPEKAKIFTRKGKRFAKFKDAKGHTAEARLTKKSDKILVETAHWHIGFEDNLAIKREVKAYTNEQASNKLAERINELLCCQANNQQLSVELQKWLDQVPERIRDELISFGLIDPRRIAAGKILTDLISEFEKSLQSKERSTRYVQQTVAQIKKVFKGCGFRYWSDIEATKVENHLRNLRDNGIGYGRSNTLLHSVKSFCNWVVCYGLASESPLRHLKPLNEELDKRHERRALKVDEIRRLLEAALRGSERFGLTGYARCLLYRLVCETGLRANEIRTLTVGSFDFRKLTVTIEAGSSKHRQKDVQPLRADFAVLLEQFFTGKLPNVIAFGGTKGRLTKDTAEMVRADLADAGIPYKDDAGRVADFHSLRHVFITYLHKAPSRVAQALARHRSSAMTDRYTHIGLHDERAALEGLPDFSLPSKEIQKATGTDGENLSKSCLSGVPTRINMDNNGQTTLDKTQKTKSGADNRGTRGNYIVSAGSGNRQRPFDAFLPLNIRKINFII